MTKKLPKAIISDLDGTLALLRGRNPYSPKTIMDDELNEPIANIIKLYKQNTDVELIIVSGRYEKYMDETRKWLKKHGLEFYKKLLMRPNNDRRADYTLKLEMYEENIKGKYDVLFVLDDRDQVVELWRELGFTCLQVAEGDF